jgi:predicted RNase H-like HicB family nuclease
MKTLKCDLCDATAQGETFEEWMENMKPHYMDAHADMMQKMGEKSEEEQKAERAKWMEEMKAKFEAAS